MAQRLEGERLRTEEVARESLERDKMIKAEMQTKRFDELYLAWERANQADERELMGVEELRQREVWEVWDKELKQEEDALKERELRKEWTERGKMGREEKTQQRQLSTILLILGKRQEAWERELMGEEDKDTTLQRTVELEGYRLMPLVWTPQEAAIQRCMKNVDQQAYLTILVRDATKFLNVPMAFPLPICANVHDDEAKEASSENSKHKWKMGMKKVKLGMGGAPAAPSHDSWSADSAATGETAQEVKALGKAGGDNSAAWLELARRCVKLFQTTLQRPYLLQAESAYREALKSVAMVHNLDLLVEAAEVYAEAGEFQSRTNALAIFGNMITRHPEYEHMNNKVIFRLATLMKHQDQLPEALKYWIHLHQHGCEGWEPGELLWLVSREYETTGNAEMARLGYQQVHGLTKQDIKDSEDHIRLSEFIDNWREWLNTPNVWEKFADRMVKRGEFMLSIDFYKQAIRRIPHDMQRDDIWMKLATSCQRAYDVHGARGAFAKALELKPYDKMVGERLKWEFNGAFGSRWKVEQQQDPRAAQSWIEVAGDHVYYYNTITLETRWDRPGEMDYY